MTKYLILTAISVIILILMYLGILYYLKPKHDILAKQVTVSSKPTEILGKKSLVINKQIHEACLVLDAPYKVDFDNKVVKLPNNETTEVKIKLIDNNGQEFPLILYSIGRPDDYPSDETACFSIASEDKETTKGKEFRKLQVSSDLIIQVKAITWIGYNLK